MRLQIALPALLAAAFAVPVAAQDTATPADPDGWGEAVSGFAQAGLTDDIVTGIAKDPANPPGAVADDVTTLREQVYDSAPTPPSGANPGKPR